MVELRGLENMTPLSISAGKSPFSPVRRGGFWTELDCKRPGQDWEPLTVSMDPGNGDEPQEQQMDMSKTIRQPLVVAGRISTCVDKIAHLRSQLTEVEDELRQLLAINDEVWRDEGYPMAWSELQACKETGKA